VRRQIIFVHRVATQKKYTLFPNIGAANLLSARGSLVRGGGVLLRTTVISTLIAFSMLGVSAAADSDAAIIRPVDIPAQPLGSALETLAKTRGFQVIYFSDDVDSLRTLGASGPLTADQALSQLLSGSGLSFSHLDASTVTVFPTDARGPVRLAAAGGGAAATAAASSDPTDSETKASSGPIDEVTVTGSRLAKPETTEAQEVQSYSRQRIEQSGQSTLADFLNTLPNVSTNINENSFQTLGGATTVSLHGLPVGTTLVLLDGRRLEPSALQGSTGEGEFFDLNNIPLAAVERVEVVPEGSSAIYGSDAIAGVVNIILKKNLQGFEGNVKYGEAADTHEWNGDAAWGHHWDRGSLQIIANYNYRTPLHGYDRSVTGRSAYTETGCGQADVFSINGQPLPGLGGANYAYVPAGFTGTASIDTFAKTAGSLARCQIFPYAALIPQSKRAGIMINGTLQLSANIEAFGGVLYSHVTQREDYIPPALYGIPSAGFSQFTVGANNPYNPFGVDVGVSALYPAAGITVARLTSEFVQPVVGFRGRFASDWHWQASVYESRDRQYYLDGRGSQTDPAIQTALSSSDPATAFNPFTTGQPASTSILNAMFPDWGQTSTDGQTVVAAADARGSVLRLPSGAVQLALGTEYDRDRLYADIVNEVPYYAPNTTSVFHRDRYALFAETRVPLWAGEDRLDGQERLVATLAVRRDHYDDFGSRTTPQVGLAFKPTKSLLLRGSLSRSFKAPSLFDLHGPQYIGENDNVADPQRGNEIEVVTITSGSNPHLKAETGKSSSFGLVYNSDVLANLQLSVTHWDVQLDNAIQSLPVQTLLDNANLFPNTVVRASSCSDGPPCPIVAINGEQTNFGQIDVKGLDYRIAYRLDTRVGTFSPAINATQTYHFRTLLTPGAPAVGVAGVAQDDAIWAPRWRGNAMLAWSHGTLSASAIGRYVGRYRDYDTSSTIGNFWLFDANLRWAVGDEFFRSSNYLSGSYAELGGVNLLNKEPQYSNYEQGILGYDPAQADIRQRFIYVRLGVRL
jgi:iron complex outermembrane receptor protein